MWRISFVQKLGYCEHYATAGAVLFRAMGIPSRYVSGYRVPASDFVDNGDGTYTAKVLDQEAHAWTEVYSLSSGWTVADMTPSAQDATGQINNNGSGFTQTAPTEEPDFGDDTFLENDPQSSERQRRILLRRKNLRSPRNRLRLSMPTDRMAEAAIRWTHPQTEAVPVRPPEAMQAGKHFLRSRRKSCLP